MSNSEVLVDFLDSLAPLTFQVIGKALLRVGIFLFKGGDEVVDIASVTYGGENSSIFSFNSTPNSFCLQGLSAMNAVPYWKRIPQYHVPVWHRHITGNGL